MLKLHLKNYLKNLTHFLIPMGAIFLGLLIGVSVVMPILSASANNLIDGVKQLVPDGNLDFNELFQNFWDSVK